MCLVVLIASAGCSATEFDPKTEADLLMAIAERRGFAPDEQLEWSYQVVGVSEESVSKLIARVRDLGFADVTVPEQDEANDAGEFEVWFSEVAKHDRDSLTARIEKVRDACTEIGGSIDYLSVTRPEPAP